MPQKRSFPSSGSGSSPYAKRARASHAEDSHDDEDTPNSVTPYERPRNHPVFGQKSAFPGLDTNDKDDELFYGPAEDGLEYLRMVRSEANSLPTLFTVPTTTGLPEKATEVSGNTDRKHVKSQQELEIKEEAPSAVKRLPEGVYSDGVYIGLTISKPIANEAFSEAQASYYNLLHHRFLLLRSILRCTPPSEAISALDDSHPISFPRHSKTAQKEWRRLLLTVDPQMVQLACMDMNTVLGVLVIVARLMSENVRSGDVALVRRIGAWAWGLLGKCRDSGQLGAQEIGDIRELGKRAMKIQLKLREEKEVQDDEEDDGEESDVEIGNGENAQMEANGAEPDRVTGDTNPDQVGAEKDRDAEELELAKTRLEARISTAGDEPDSQGARKDEKEGEIEEENSGIDVETQTRAMLDMIVTIVGEHYGQRDLLGAREIWTDAEQRFLLSTVPRCNEPIPFTMAPPLEISIPTTTTSTTSPPYTIYNITLRLPLRSFAVSKRYSDFTAFNSTLASQTNAPPPHSLPSKSWFSNTVSNTDLRESRRSGLESYLRAINESDDPRWRNSPAWRAFLNLPSLGNPTTTNTNTNTLENGKSESGVTASSARLHAAITGPGGIGGTSEPITDPTLWLDCYRDLKSHLHDARLHLTRRDQETTPQRQHESSARAKSSLVRAGTLIAALDEGLKSSSANSKVNGRHTASNSLGEGELRRRRDLLINAGREKDGLEELLNAMAAKSRIDNAVASIKDKESLLGSGSPAGRKPAARSGRVLGKETDKTRELDNQGLLQLQQDTMREQDLNVRELLKVVQRQKELGIRINEELEIQNEMLRMVDEDATRLDQKVGVGKKRLGKIS
ncbi:uncharacterized protein BJX67DRAFT_371337 [Aspergillus lucknowensis]|uniref:Uncharacterized protein n=1 Tax=Aspergillus lucknowensis TaxID=176173 RepID=A0ABR4LVT2_9EURO